MSQNQYPKLHNAMWPGIVGKGPDAEPTIDLDTMLDLTAAAEVNGVKFDGVDIFLYSPHIDIDISDDDLKALADKIASKGLTVGSVVAPIWPPTGGGSAMGNAEERQAFVQQVRKGCRIASQFRALGVRPHGVVRIDSACSPADYLKDPANNLQLIAQTFREACDVAESFGERLAAEGEICWGGLHSWRVMILLLEAVGRPQTLGFQADMAHTLLYTMGYNAPEDALLPPDYDWQNQALFDAALKQLTAALRPWTIDFHVAQNDGTVKGSGSHDKTGHHCLPDDPNGKLDIAHHAGFWLRDERGDLTRAFKHMCWDGCMFPNATMMDPTTWNHILAAMIAVRDAHGWTEPAAQPAPEPPVETMAEPVVRPVARPAAGKPQASPKPAAVAIKVTTPPTPAPVAAKPAARKTVRAAAPKPAPVAVPKKAAKKPAKKAPQPAARKTIARKPAKATKAPARKSAKTAATKKTRPSAKAAAKRKPVRKPARTKATRPAARKAMKPVAAKQKKIKSKATKRRK